MQSCVFFSLFPNACCQHVNNSGPMDAERKAESVPWLMHSIIQQRLPLSLCAFRSPSHERELGADVETLILKMGEEITIHFLQ